MAGEEVEVSEQSDEKFAIVDGGVVVDVTQRELNEALAHPGHMHRFTLPVEWVRMTVETPPPEWVTIDGQSRKVGVTDVIRVARFGCELGCGKTRTVSA